jgi:hypothetical protein
VSARVLSSLTELSKTGEVNSVNKYPLPRRVVGRVVCAGGTPDVAGGVAGGGCNRKALLAY